MLLRLFLGSVFVLPIGSIANADETTPADLVRSPTASNRIDLAGQWRVFLGNAESTSEADVDPTANARPNDPLNDSREARKVDPLDWRFFNPQNDPQAMSPVRLPGTLRDSELGPVVGPDTDWIASTRENAYRSERYDRYRTADQFKMPFWWQPKRHFVGAAWYQTEITIPERWAKQQILLTLERPHWRTQVWIDGQHVGSDDSLGTAHVYDLTEATASSQVVQPGTHTLTIGVDNGTRFLDVGINSHSITDHTQTAWHGIIGEIALTAKPQVAIGDIAIYPQLDSRQVQLRLRVDNASNETCSAQVQLVVTQNAKPIGQSTRSVTVPPGGVLLEPTLSLSAETLPWDEFSPNLCELTATLVLNESKAPSDLARRTFGMRSVGVDGRQLTLNGRPMSLRGTLECCVFPLTGYPPTDVASWKRIIRICKAHGLNHIRFHSWCPPQAAFVAADELGFYYQVECSSWPNQSTALSSGRDIDDWLEREAQRVVAAYGNHPSFVLLAAGNEASGPKNGAAYLSQWVKRRQADRRHLVTSAAGWPLVPENDFHISLSPRIHQWGSGVRDRINSQAPATTANYSQVIQRTSKPVVGHEIGQWCVFPNFDEIEKYSGSLQVKNFEIFRDQLSDAGMLDQADDFLMASGKLQMLAYKEEIESSLRTPKYGGFQILDLRDFPGQGTALVGVLDPFWDEKPYTTASQFRRFCGPIVPLAEMKQRVWNTQEPFNAQIMVSHFGSDDLTDAVVAWSLVNDATATTLDQGSFTQTMIAKDGLRRIGEITASLAKVTSATKLRLVVSVESRGQEMSPLIENDWELWVYPHPASSKHRDVPDSEPVSNASEFLSVTRLGPKAIDHLSHGGTVLLLPSADQIDSDVRTGMSPIFWNTVWTNREPPHTLGLLCDPKHPLFRDFVTDSHSNWQWWELLQQAGAMDLSHLTSPIQPIVQLIPDWFAPKRLATLFECTVGDGKLLVCSMNITDRLDQRPVARSLRASINRYIVNDEFAPTVEVTVEQLRRLFVNEPFVSKFGVVADAFPHARTYDAINAIDGDPSTIWHTVWSPSPLPHPHHLTIDLGEVKSLDGIRYTPRQDLSRGRIARYQINVSDNARSWTTVATGTFHNSAMPRSVRFTESQDARYIQLVALAEVNGRSSTSVAEVDVILSSPAAH